MSFYGTKNIFFTNMSLQFCTLRYVLKHVPVYVFLVYGPYNSDKQSPPGILEYSTAPILIVLSRNVIILS